MEKILAKVGDIVVRTQITVPKISRPEYLVGYIFKVCRDSSGGGAYYNKGSSISQGNWRFATDEEKLHFKLHGITNISEINNMKHKTLICEKGDIIVRLKNPEGNSVDMPQFQPGYIFRAIKTHTTDKYRAHYKESSSIIFSKWRHATVIERTYFEHYNIVNISQIDKLYKQGKKFKRFKTGDIVEILDTKNIRKYNASKVGTKFIITGNQNSIDHWLEKNKHQSVGSHIIDSKNKFSINYLPDDLKITDISRELSKYGDPVLQEEIINYPPEHSKDKYLIKMYRTPGFKPKSKLNILVVNKINISISHKTVKSIKLELL